jgi:uncharacterized membrane protein YbhN (UPF0104 family)
MVNLSGAGLPGNTGLKGAITVCAGLALIYIAILIWTDKRNDVFGQLPRLVGVLPLVMACSLLGYVVRYARWRWLLLRGGPAAFPQVRGFVAYLTGFALTASPGKVGELLRIRYFQRLGVSADRVIACFVFERLMDLIVLLALALPLAQQAPGFRFGVAFVGLGLATVALATVLPRLRYYPIQGLRHLNLRAPARWVRTFGLGLGGIRSLARPLTFLGAFAFGAVYWGLQSLGLIVMLRSLGTGPELLQALPIMPTATLIGAASLLPGGVGTTEAATVAILHLFAVPTAAAVLAAIGVRLGSIWFAMLLGIAACLALERVQASANSLQATRATTGRLHGCL